MGTKIEVIFSTGDDFLAKFSSRKGSQWGCEKGVSESYRKFVQANAEAAESLIPKVKKQKQANLSNNLEISKKREEVQCAFKEWIEHNDNEHHEILKEKKDSLNQLYHKLQENELNEKITKLEECNALGRHRDSWKLINSITNRKTAKKGIIKGKKPRRKSLKMA